VTKTDDIRQPSTNQSVNDDHYRDYLRAKIERGLRDVEAGRVVELEAAKRRVFTMSGP
jgi:predicted transcriptional regulator